MKHRILSKIIGSGVYQRTIRFLKKVRLEKRGISLHDILVVFFDKIRNDEIITRANGVAFNFTLSIFPAIIFIFTLIPYIQIAQLPDLNLQIMDFLREWMPEDMYDVAAGTISDILSNRRGGLLSFGFFFSLFLATNGMMSLMQAFNKCYRTVDNRNFWKSRFIATSLTLMLAVVLFFAMLLLVIGQQLINFLETTDFFYINMAPFAFYMVLLLRFVVLFFIFLFAISSIYFWAPAVHDRWKFFSPGSLTATLLSLGVTFAFTYYVNNFGTYNTVYGSIGVLIALMVWLLILSIIILVGFEINASIDKTTRIQPIQPVAHGKLKRAKTLSG